MHMFCLLCLFFCLFVFCCFFCLFFLYFFFFFCLFFFFFFFVFFFCCCCFFFLLLFLFFVCFFCFFGVFFFFFCFVFLSNALTAYQQDLNNSMTNNTVYILINLSLLNSAAAQAAQMATMLYQPTHSAAPDMRLYFLPMSFSGDAGDKLVGERRFCGL